MKINKKMSVEDLASEENKEKIKLLKESGFSKKSINYFLNEVNVGKLENADVSEMYTGPCGDTMAFYLNIKENIITNAKFQAIGCAGAYSSGSALTKMIEDKTLNEVREIDEKDILEHLGGLPASKIHCACLALKTLKKTIEKYESEHKI